MTDHGELDAKVEELAMTCLDRLAEGSEPGVEQVCSEFPELIARVRGLLHQLECVGLVEPTAAASFGDFRLLRKLGEGGMGVVWLAEQPRLRRTVALKLLRPGMHLHERLRERFRREVQALSKLDHPNICTVYEAGEVDGSPYLAMRYIDGDSLQQLLDQRRKDRPAQGSTVISSRELFELVHLVEKVAMALHAAHRAGVVHRDVKPGNILIDVHGEPVLVDFGLAHDDDPALSVLTLSGEPLGTPAYMAPEQIAGSAAVDQRTDVYALGAVLFECATLQPPFTGPSRDTLYRSIVHDPLPDPRKQNRAVGRDLRAVLEKALAKEPRQRFASALDLAEELGRIRRREPVRTRAIGPLRRTLRWCQRNRAATTVMAVVSAALMVSVWALRRSIAAEMRFQAGALVAAAEQVATVDPELAFKLQREALRLQAPADADPMVVAAVQQTMFRLRPYREVRTAADGRLELVRYSPDPAGRFFVVSGKGLEPTLHRGKDGATIEALPHLMPFQKPAIAFSPTGDALAVGDDQGRVHVYELGSGRPVRVAGFGPGTATQVTAVAWSPDERLVLAHLDGAASVWTRQGGLVRALPPVDASLIVEGARWRAAVFLPDGRVVAAGAIWSADLQRATRLQCDGQVVGNIGRIACTATRLLTHETERPGARLWDLDGKLLFTSRCGNKQRDAVLYGGFDPQGARFTLSFGDGRLEFYDAESWAMRDVIRIEAGGAIVDGAWSRDGSQLALACFTGSVHVWREGQGQPLALAGHLGQAFSVDFAPQGDRLLSASWEGKARMWQLEEPVDGVMQVRTEGIPDIALVRDGVLVATGRSEVLLCTRDGGVLRHGAVGPGWCTLGVAPGGTKVAIASTEGSVWTWDLERPEPPQLRTSKREALFDCGWMADGRILVRSLGTLGVMQLVGEELEPVKLEATRMAVSPDGQRLLLGTFDGGWQSYELRGGELQPGPAGRIEAGQGAFGVAFSPDGAMAMVGTADGQVTCWDVATGKELARYRDHRNQAFTPGASPDGRRLASVSIDGTVRVHELAHPDDVLVLSTAVRESVFKAVWLDDQRVVTAGGNAVRWWWVDAEGLAGAVDKVPVRELTPEEELRYRRLLPR